MAKQKKTSKTNIVAFTCHWGGYPVLQGAEINDSGDLNLVRLMCGGRVSVGLILRAFEKGADGVAVIACDEKECHYGFGAAKCGEEFELARRMAHLLGVGDHRLAFHSVHPGDMEQAREDLGRFVKAVKKAGRLNVRTEEG